MENKSKFDDARLDAMMERYRAEIFRLQGACSPMGNRLTAVTPRHNTAQEAVPTPVSPVDYEGMSDVEIFNQPAVLVETKEEVKPQALDIPEVEIIQENREEPPTQTYYPAQKPTVEQAYSPAQSPLLSSLYEIGAMASARRASRMMFAKGVGAYGTFKPYERFGGLCRATFLMDPSVTTPVFARFSSNVGRSGADALRCQRGMALSFNCPDGELNILAQHLPVTFVREADYLPKLLEAMGTNPLTGLHDNGRLWRFICEHPQALHAMLWLYSDLGTAGSYGNLEYYAMPLILVNAAGESRAARLRITPKARTHPLSRFEAEELAGCDSDALSRDLIMAIQKGEKVQFELGAQIINSRERDTLEFDPFDPTLQWNAVRFPVAPLGLLSFDSLPQNHEQEVERAAFSPAMLVDGIELPCTGIYAAKAYGCAASQRARLGQEAVTTTRMSYAGDWCRQWPEANDMTILRERLLSINERERRRLIDNLAEELSKLDAPTLEAVLMLFTKAELSFGKSLTVALEMS